MPAPQRPMRRAPQDAQNNAATRGASSTACRRRTDDSPEKCSTRRPHNMPHPRLPRHPAVRPRDSAPSLFPPASVPTPPRRPPSLPERPFRSDLHSGAFHRAPVFSPAPVKPRAAPALLPFPARIPTSPPRSALPLVPASDPPRFPRAFSCAFPALLPHSIPPFCASFVKKHHKVRAAAQNLCNAAHLRALRPGLRRNSTATSPAGHRSPT